MKPIKIKGRALRLKEGVYDQGIEKSRTEWVKMLGYSDGQHGQVGLDYIRRQLRDAGFPIACVPEDPDFPNGKKVLRPLTKNKTTARYANRRYRTMTAAYATGLSMGLYRELLEWPDMLPEALEHIESLSHNYVSFKKIALSRDAEKLKAEYARLADGRNDEGHEDQEGPKTAPSNIRFGISR